ncbi:MAG: DUF1285 domain-containing protein [Pseudomonadota bacterium]
MPDLMQYAAALADDPAAPPPPVERWDPAYCGELDLVIRRDGVWVHEGTPIGRAKLVRLFASVLKREGDRHFLVTPVEKLGIQVEDAPLLAIRMDVEALGRANQRLIFTTNVGDRVVAGPDNAIVLRRQAGGGGHAPYLHVRRGLEARVARAPFYELVDVGEERIVDGEKRFGVASDGAFFAFPPDTDDL